MAVDAFGRPVADVLADLSRGAQIVTAGCLYIPVRLDEPPAA